jgi:hypothetical protein
MAFFVLGDNTYEVRSRLDDSLRGKTAELAAHLTVTVEANLRRHPLQKTPGPECFPKIPHGFLTRVKCLEEGFGGLAGICFGKLGAGQRRGRLGRSEMGGGFQEPRRREQQDNGQCFGLDFQSLTSWR